MNLACIFFVDWENDRTARQVVSEKMTDSQWAARRLRQDGGYKLIAVIPYYEAIDEIIPMLRKPRWFYNLSPECPWAKWPVTMTMRSAEPCDMIVDMDGQIFYFDEGNDAVLA